MNNILKSAKYIFLFFLFLILLSCTDNVPQQHPSVKKHEEVVLKFWQNNSPEILSFFLKYEDLNKTWGKKLDQSSTKGNTSYTIDTIVEELELESLKTILNSPNLMFYEIHVGPKNGYSSDIIFPKKYTNSNYKNYLLGLTYGINEFHRKDINLNLTAFNDPNIKTDSQIGYNSIKLWIFSKLGDCEVYYRLKKHQ